MRLRSALGRSTTIPLFALLLVFGWWGSMGCTPKQPTVDRPPKSTATVKPSAPGDGSVPSDAASPSAIALKRIRFQQVTDSGLDFTYRNGEQADQYCMIESNGGGVGWLDFDRDGHWDIFASGGGLISETREVSSSEHGLFQAGGSEKFRRVDGPAFCRSSRCYSFGSHVADYDQDGFPDVLVTGYGGQQLFRNQGDGSFEDVTRACELVDRKWSSSAAWCDIDRDGLLDVYITHYAEWNIDNEKRCFGRYGGRDRCVPSDFQGEADQLLRQTGEGRFVDVSDRVAASPSRGLGVVAGDWDVDGDIDLYVANDVHANLQFQNDGQGHFEETATSSGTALGSRAVVDGSMGVAVGDYDGNLLVDFLVTNYQGEYCELFANQGKNYFKVMTRKSGMMLLGSKNVAWGTSFLDADQDGDEDLFIVSGHTSRVPADNTNRQLPAILENVQHQRLVSLGASAGKFFEEGIPGRGLAIGDLEGDGDLDAIVTLLDEPLRVVENVTEEAGGYLLVDLVGTLSNRDAIGAIVECETELGRTVRHRFGGGSYASTSFSSLHFGLGQATRIEQLTIRWPSGGTSSLKQLAMGQRILVVEGSDSFAGVSSPPKSAEETERSIRR